MDALSIYRISEARASSLTVDKVLDFTASRSGAWGRSLIRRSCPCFWRRLRSSGRSRRRREGLYRGSYTAVQKGRDASDRRPSVSRAPTGRQSTSSQPCPRYRRRTRRGRGRSHCRSPSRSAPRSSLRARPRSRPLGRRSSADAASFLAPRLFSLPPHLLRTENIRLDDSVVHFCEKDQESLLCRCNAVFVRACARAVVIRLATSNILTCS